MQQRGRQAEGRPGQQVAQGKERRAAVGRGVSAGAPVERGGQQYGGRRGRQHHRDHHDPPHEEHQNRVGGGPRLRHDHVHVHAGVRRVGHFQHRHAHAGAGQNIQPGAQHHDEKTGGHRLAVTPQDVIERPGCPFLVQRGLQLVDGATLRVLYQANLAVGAVQVQPDGSRGPGIRIDDLGRFKLDTVRNLDLDVVR